MAQAGDVLVVARLTRVAGVPRPDVVALGALADGGIVSAKRPTGTWRPLPSGGAG